MERHYIPSIEEFHVGFEYEIKDWWTMEGTPGWLPGTSKEEIDKCLAHKPEIPDGFTRRTLTKDMLYENLEIKGTDYRHEWERITTGIKDGTVRVKYLDRKDIASLGFIHLGSGWFEKDHYRIRKWVEHQVDIYEWNPNKELGYGEIIFRGIIRNKSELIKLLQQL